MLKHPWLRQTFKKWCRTLFFPQEGALSIWSREHSVQAGHRSSKRWAVVPSTVQKMNISYGGRVTKTFFSLCPTVPPLSNAGKVYDWYCPRDGVPQQQELHPQRPCSSQLHVSAVSASTFYSLGSCLCYHLLFLFPFLPCLKKILKRTKSRLKGCAQSNICERGNPL